MAVAGPGDPTGAAPGSRGMLARDQARETHQLARGVEAGDGAELGEDRHGAQDMNAPEADQVRHPPVNHIPGGSDQSLAAVRIGSSRSATRRVASRAESTYSWKTICWTGLSKARDASVPIAGGTARAANTTLVGVRMKHPPPHGMIRGSCGGQLGTRAGRVSLPSGYPSRQTGLMQHGPACGDLATIRGC